MSKELSEALENEILTQIQSLDLLEVGSEEKLKAVEAVCKLHKAAIDGSCLKEGKYDKYVNWLLKAAEIGLPLIIGTAFMNAGFEFEKENTFTSLTFKNLFGLFKLKR